MQTEEGYGFGVALAGGQLVPGVLGTRSITQTALAERVAPPERRPDSGAGLQQTCGVALLVIAGLALAVMLQMLTSPEHHVPNPIALVSLCTGLFIVPPVLLGWVLLHRANKSLREIRRYNEDVWPDLYEAWLRSFLCMRCGHAWTLRRK